MNIDILATQQFAMVVRVVAWLVAKHSPIRVASLQQGIVGIAVDHQATGVRVTQRYVDEVRDVGRAELGRKRALVDR